MRAALRRAGTGHLSALRSFRSCCWQCWSFSRCRWAGCCGRTGGRSSRRSLWIFVLLGALLAAVLYVGVVVGWPLMWGALSTEEMGDVFEATQRSFSYTFGRPLHYAWYALVTLLVGSAAFVVVEWMAELIVYMSFWLVSWGAGSDALHALRDPAGGNSARA